MSHRKLPVGIQSFEKIRKENYLYIDKTSYIWKLVNDGSIYFLSRPRRFGKSLLISTMEAYFQGKKELFEGLAIKELEDGRGAEAWQEYPVIRFSLSGRNYNTENGLRDRLNDTIEKIINLYKLDNQYRVNGETLDQIEEKGYASPYKADPREVIEIGVNFRTDKRNIGEWII